MRHTVSFTLLNLLPSSVRWADVVHLTAVYSFPTLPTLLVCSVLGKPLVWSPRGSLTRWSGSKQRGLKRAWEWACRMVASNRLILHMTSDEEAKESAQHFKGVRTVVIPNGIDVPHTIQRNPPNGILRLLYLGRIDPKKGIENLLMGCRLWNDHSRKPWLLTIAGHGEGRYAESIGARIADLGLSQHVVMKGGIVGQGKAGLFENADIVVVPSFTENFGMVVAEALAYGVPVIASRGTPWRRIEELGCGLWVENVPEILAKAIERMSQMSLQKMGDRGRQWMVKEFSWDDRVKKMLECYRVLRTKHV
jgi:glycosyltransferase involved in cell wall biosynthesis